MAEIEEVGALLDAEESKPTLESPERSDIDVIYEKSQNKSDSAGHAVYEVNHYDGIEEEFYEDLNLDFETSVERMALDRENERAVFHNTDDTYEVLEVVETAPGKMAMKGQIYGQEDTWAMIYDSDEQSLHGMNMSTGVKSELNDPNLMNKAEMLKNSIIHSEKIMETYLRSDEYRFVRTDKMNQDFERIPEAEGKIWSGNQPRGKLADIKENLDALTDVEPKEAFTKECTGPMKPGLQVVYDGYRFIFHDGSRTEGLDDQTFYGIRAFSKDRDEQREFADDLLDRDEGFNEYAERMLREEGTLE